MVIVLTITFAHSAGVACAKVSLAVMPVIACCDVSQVEAVMGRAVAATLFGCHA
jgi:thymidine phosphorylase